MRRTPSCIERRTFVAGALALPASCGWIPRAVAAHAKATGFWQAEVQANQKAVDML